MKFVCCTPAALLLALPLSLPLPAAENHLDFPAAVKLAEQNFPGVAAQRAALAAAQSAQSALGRLPDPRLVVGIDNLPTEEPDRFSLDADFMTMQRIGLMQEVPNRVKRQAQAQGAQAAATREQATLAATVQGARRNTAQAWLAVYFAEQRRAVLADIEHDNSLLQDSIKAGLAAGQTTSMAWLSTRQEALALADRRDELAAAVVTARAKLRQMIGDRADWPLAGEPPELSIDPAYLHSSLAKHVDIAPYLSARTRAETELAEAEAAKRGDWAWALSYAKRGVPFGDMVSAEVSIDLPLWKASRQGPTIAARRHDLERTDAEREDAIRRHRADLNSDLALLDALDSQHERLHARSVPLAEQRTALALANYQTGTGDIVAVFAARREMLELRLRGLDLDEQRFALRAHLHYLIVEKTP
ncbi:MAG: TolC family protein [Pseudomonadota bacterium]